nr:GLNRPS8 [Glarea lozoyensis]
MSLKGSIQANPVFIPFNFSASSESSLRASLKAYSGILKENESVDLRDLSGTLAFKRNAFAVKASFSGLTTDSLCSKIDSTLKTEGSNIGIRSVSKSPSILAVFTGQGAQWAGMGRELILGSDAVLQSVERLETYLTELPIPDRPSWSLKKELLATAPASRLSEASIAQPLCTALQIILVDLLRSAEVKFTAVVGHSSGEIGAAYACGHISAKHAMYIAYYRGFHSQLATGPDGKRGAMMAVATSMEDAQEMCDIPDFAGRLSVAASNSATSVTLSGDFDAVEEAKQIFDEEKKFARLLKVDKAYHSHHMLPCTEKYIESLRRCEINVGDLDNMNGSWFSSVYGGEFPASPDSLADVYWNTNMLNPVLFSQAIGCAASTKGPFDVVLEVGPHPALQGPVLEVIQQEIGKTIPYCGVLSRGKNDIETLSDALGLIWSHLGASAVNFQQYDSLMSGGASFEFQEDLPLYAWDHERRFWYESRVSENYRTRQDSCHELLGVRVADGTEQEIRWRNMLSVKEVPWLRGHQIQGEIVFPAAGYVTMALEASLSLAGERSVVAIEVQDLVIGRPISFADEESGVETLFTLTNVSNADGSATMCTANFTCYSSPQNHKRGSTMILTATGHLQISLGDGHSNLLSSRPIEPLNLVEVDTSRFYSALSDLGYGYSGPFKGLSTLKRKMDVGTGLVASTNSTNTAKPMLIHPAMLDSAFQAIFLGYGWPGDGRLWSMHVPTKIEKVKVNVSLCRSELRGDVQLPFDCILSDNPLYPIYGDIDIFTRDGRSSIVQIEGVTAVPLSAASRADDRNIFSDISWNVALPNGLIAAENDRAKAEDFELALLCERVAHLYLMELDKTFPPEVRASLQWNFQRLLDFASYTVRLVAAGRHPFAKKEWTHDTREQVIPHARSFTDSTDLKLMLAVGDNLPAAIRGETEILEHMTRGNILDDYYVSALGLPQCTRYIAKMASQFVNRYSNPKILEIGAGTGGATKSILKYLKEQNQTVASYTFTDISGGYFEKAREVFKDLSGNMLFSVLDVEKDVVSQGYSEHSYDLVIASMVLHATSKLENTMKNVRRLLKPGGYLLMLETTSNSPSRIGFTMGGLPGWWLGADDGRALSPCVPSAKWDEILRNTGFGGVDSITPELDPLPCPLSVIASQAVDNRVSALRKPLQSPTITPLPQNLFVLGGTTLLTAQLARGVVELLRGRYNRVTVVDHLENINTLDLPPMSTVLSLTDLDEPVFMSMTTKRLESLKGLFDQSRNVLWLTTGCLGKDPYANMIVGFGRTLVLEMSHIRLQFLDVDIPDSLEPQALADVLLRLQITGQWETEGTNSDVLWTTEPELALDQRRLMLPRVYLNKAQNDRYNSSRRPITKQLDSSKSKVGVIHTGDSYTLREWNMPNHAQNSHGANCVDINVRHSLLSSIKISTGASLYLSIGSTLDSNKLVLALSETQTSAVSTPEAWTTPCDIAENQQQHFLLSVAHNLVAQSILALTDADETILLNEPGDSFARVTTQRAAEKNLHVAFATTSAERGSPWVLIRPSTSKRLVKSMLPDHVSVFMDMSSTSDSEEAVGHLVSACLSPACRIVKSSVIFSPSAIVLPKFSTEQIARQLKHASQHAEIPKSQELIPPKEETLLLTDFPKSLSSTSRFSLINWTHQAPAQVNLEPIDSKPMFSKDKTYLLFGLTGGLGQSLTQWMVHHGARFIVLTSRKPSVEAQWLRDLEALGATVQVFQNDITDEQSVRNLCDEVRKTFPPIAGIANGAMVLDDTPILNMTIEKLDKVLAPKVKGSIYLDKLFANDDLEFFILFSSLACVLGNKGQSNYTTANSFMVSLASQRRNRGLAASVINIGATVGNGYLTRERSQELQDYLRKAGFMWMSERDFQQVFAEGVVAGRVDSGQSGEVVSGLRVTNDAEEKTIWYNNPKFQHCIIRQSVDETNSEKAKPIVPLKTELLHATNKEEIERILKDSIVLKLRTALLLSSDSADMMDKNADDLGIDSLVSVSLRSWFLKELHIDMPVMKILGGSTIGQLLSFAVVKLPVDLTPNLNASISSPKSKIHSTDSAPTVKESDVRETSETYSKVESSSSSSSVSLIQKESSETGSFTPISPSSSSFSMATPSDKPRSTKRFFKRTHKMSFGQSRFWFLTSFLADKTTFNVTCSIHVTGPLIVNQFANAVKSIGQRHEGLRTCFFDDEDQGPMQGILENSLLHLEQKTVEETQVVIEFARMKAHVYDLEHGETMKILLLSESTASHHLIIGYHHINMDGVSLMVLLSDLERAYSGKPLASDILQYPEFSEKQRQQHTLGNFENDIIFWKREFNELPPTLPILSLSTVTTRRVIADYSSNKAEVRISAALSQSVRKICREAKATPFHFYLAVFQILLTRFSGVDDICIGVADAGRSDSGAFESIGHYLNVVPLRSKLQRSQSFSSILANAKAKAYAALANANVPIDVLLNELGVVRSTTNSPLFQAFIDYRNVPETQTFGNCKLEGQEYSVGRTAYDILLDIVDNSAGESLLSIVVQQDLYTNGDADILMKAFINLIEVFAVDPQVGMEAPSLYSLVDVEDAIKLGTGPSLKSTWEETLPHRIDSVGRKAGSQVAVKDGLGHKLTYTELMKRTNTIASELSGANIFQQPSPRVAVFQEPTVDWVCSVLAIMRLGATYVPLDLRAPLPRLATIVKDCHPQALLFHNATSDYINKLDLLDTAAINISHLNSRDVEVSNCANPDSPAVILYTSGSTGVPKGICLHHRAIRNQIEGFSERWEITSDIVLQQSAFSFDISLWEMFTALANSGTVFIVSKASRGDPVALSKIIWDESITLTIGVTSEYITWLRYGEAKYLQQSSWRLMLCGGEPFSDILNSELKALGKPDLRAVNVYGPTEVSFFSNELEVLYKGKGDDLKLPMPVGPAGSNYSIYILDENLDPVPAGVPGEIYIGGASIATQYINDKALSSHRFLDNKFASPDWLLRGWKTMHRSGDWGRLRKEDGALMFEGRIVGDTQIKLRGLRIELRDVESTILSQATGVLEDVVVSVRGDPQFLVAHVVFRGDYHSTEETRDKYLKRLVSSLPLPQYMCPAMAVTLKTMLLNNHSKKDRRAISDLPLPEKHDRMELDSSHALTPTETRLKDIWEVVLTKHILVSHTINEDSDFFHSGGNSMILMALQSSIKQHFSVSLPLVKLFEESTLRRMASCIESGSVQQQASLDINWKQEIELDANTLTAPAYREKAQPHEPRVVLLTGSTGFLGKAMLRQLVEQESIQKIYCIAVRGEQRFSEFPSKKIKVYAGDLTLPRLGLSLKDAEAVFNEVDTIIHNGADVSFLKTYSTLKAANLTSTVELANLGLRGSQPQFHYVSSAGVAQLTGKEVIDESSVVQYHPPTDGSNGYSASKWASEAYLERVHQHSGLPVFIHRPSSIIGEDAPELDIMHNLLRYSRKMKAVPDLSSWRGWFDFIPVDDVASGILKATSLHRSLPSPVLKYIHQSGQIEVPIGDFKTFLENESKDEFEMFSSDDWIRRAQESGLHELVATYMSQAASVPVVLPRMARSDV